jgi:hypothetical protein
VRAALPAHPGLVLGPCVDRDARRCRVDFGGATWSSTSRCPTRRRPSSSAWTARPLPRGQRCDGAGRRCAGACSTRYAERAPVLWSSNFSLGVALLRRLVRQRRGGDGLGRRGLRAAPPAQGRRTERHGPDAGRGRGGTGASLPWPSRRARTPRAPARAAVDEIGVSRPAGGRRRGRAHRLLLLGEGERVELTHRATDRSVFAHGALRAAAWLVGQRSRPPHPGRRAGRRDLSARNGLRVFPAGCFVACASSIPSPHLTEASGGNGEASRKSAPRGNRPRV